MDKSLFYSGMDHNDAMKYNVFAAMPEIILKGELTPWYIGMPEGMVNSFLITGTTLFAAMSNNLLVVFNEGIHEGQAYNTSLYYFKPYSFDLKNFVFEKRSEFLSNNMTYETGKELMQSSSYVILQFTPLKPTLQAGGAALPSALQFGAKQSIKMARDFGLDSFD